VKQRKQLLQQEVENALNYVEITDPVCVIMRAILSRMMHPLKNAIIKSMTVVAIEQCIDPHTENQPYDLVISFFM
jgi:hypothetical protein